MEKLSDIGEHEAIRRLTATLGGHPHLKTGIGDDCAVAERPGSGLDQVFTTDPVIEEVHFRSADPPELIGRKAAGRVLSDLAAMGAEPQWLLVNAVAAPHQEIEVLEGVYAGIRSLCDRFGATLAGGDLACGPCLELHVFGTGTLPSGTALLRSGAKPGDAICVTGLLGGSGEGGHLDFIPRVEEGIFLRESGRVHAMMDISDGLATDLRHILRQSRCGALIEADSIPVAGTLEQALYEGEDYELLFTVAPEHTDTLRSEWEQRFETRLSQIGTVTAEADKLQLKREDGVDVLEVKAYEHFRDGSGGNAG